ncbi:MAG: response regulator [Elainellaceae cyanobacterium]
MVVPATYGFVFQAQELPQKLSQASHDMLAGMLTGYWLCEFPVADRSSQVHPLYIAFIQGRVVFSGDQQLSWHDLLKTLQHYVPRLRSSNATQKISLLEHALISERHVPHSAVLLKLLNELQKLKLVDIQEITQALRLKILCDFDSHLFDYSGRAQFLPSPQLYTQSPILGFELDSLLSDAQKRRRLWRKLQIQIPSMDGVPVLNAEAVVRSNLSPLQRQRLERLVLHSKTLSEIATLLSQDPLEIAIGFAKLIGAGLITLNLPTTGAVPEIMIVDDSPMILKQFKNLVTKWGYQATICQTPSTALQTMLCSNPAIIFLDINMPEITGFDLVKQIRRRPELATVPLIMLTADKTLSNNWRSQWSGCRFLTKPLTPQEVPQFQMDLKTLLKELAPLPSSTQFAAHLVEEK